MPTQRQIIVQQPVPSDKQFGASNYSNAKKIFPASPIHKGQVTDDERRQYFDKKVINGTIVGGMGLNSFNLDFSDAPNLEEVETGGGGLPATPYVPNITSPGPGSMNAADQPVYEGTFPGKTEQSGTEWGVGLGGLVSPSKTSKEIARQSVLSDYIMGKSFPNSNG
jgi:hypothetical protein